MKGDALDPNNKDGVARNRKGLSRRVFPGGLVSEEGWGGRNGKEINGGWHREEHLKEKETKPDRLKTRKKKRR